MGNELSSVYSDETHIPTTCPFKAYNSKEFSVFTDMCYHDHNQF